MQQWGNHSGSADRASPEKIETKPVVYKGKEYYIPALLKTREAKEVFIDQLFGEKPIQTVVYRYDNQNPKIYCTVPADCEEKEWVTFCQDNYKSFYYYLEISKHPQKEKRVGKEYGSN